MKKKLSKKAIAGIALLGTAALTGSVFAGWLIVDANARGEGKGNVTVYDVVDKSLSVKNVKFKYDDGTSKDKGNVIFGKPKTPSAFDSSNVWFTFGDDEGNSMQDESFPKNFTFDVFSGEDLKEAPTVKVTFKVEQKATEFKSCLDASLITGPEIGENGEKDLSPMVTPSAQKEDRKNKYSYDISLGFGWGVHFNNLNPYNFYNGKNRDSSIPGSSATYEQDVSSSLKKLFSLNGAKYSITIEATPSSTSAGEQSL